MSALKKIVCESCGASDLKPEELRADGGHERIGLQFDIDKNGDLVGEIERFAVPPCPGPTHMSIG